MNNTAPAATVWIPLFHKSLWYNKQQLRKANNSPGKWEEKDGSST